MTASDSGCIYLDHHATTPMDERVFQKIKPFFLSQFGNPASVNHPFGWDAQDVIDAAREEVARAINAHPTEIIFTSGATESSNMAIKGLFLPAPNVNRREIITSSIEHRATLSSVEALTCAKIRAIVLKPTREGLIPPDHVEASLSDHTALVSLFLVHNEIGSINNIKAIAREAKKRGALVHCDAAQALGRVPIDCQDLGVDLMSFSGHKVYGPKGVGVLYMRREVMDLVCPLIHGGGQEWCKRSGTLNVPGIVGMGEAARLAILDFHEENARIKMLRDRLLKNLQVLDGVVVNGTLEQRVSGNLNVSFADIDGEELVLAICRRVAISTGSACSSSAGKRSRVLEEIGVSGEFRQASIRFGLGRKTTESEIDTASELIISHVKKQRDKRSNKKTITKIVRR